MLRHLTIVATALLLSACGQSPAGEAGVVGEQTDDVAAPSENIVRDVLTAYLEANPACTPFFPMPHDVATESSHEIKRMEAFVAAGLLRREGELAAIDQPARRVIRFVTTSDGDKYVRAGSGAQSDYKSVICYGRYDMTKVSVGNADPIMGTADVTYRIAFTDAADWIEHPAVQAFYPGFRRWRDERQAEDQHETLRLRDGKWAVDGSSGPPMYDLRQLSR